ncbi:hypothetical protein AB0N93_15335 [Streptomyces sp. NPDC091267]|uniref:hypothetical protein n=1 Tax=Streptomyces sp. NPDC091267 TaxID=3155195 RepID=UPI00341910BF
MATQTRHSGMDRLSTCAPDLPPLEALSTEQLRGAACVWCAAELTTPTAVDLGPRPEQEGSSVFLFPRRCRACPKEPT